jgi:hypothetical protein
MTCAVEVPTISYDMRVEQSLGMRGFNLKAMNNGEAFEPAACIFNIFAQTGECAVASGR